MKRDVIFLIVSALVIITVAIIAAVGTDINNDGTTNRTDIAIVAQYYRTSNSTVDRNNDGIVNLFDLVSVSKNVSTSEGGSSNLTLDWFCDWSYATGTNNTVVRGVPTAEGDLGMDECFSDLNAGLPTALEVVSKSSSACSGWPTEMNNIMRVSTNADNDPALLIADQVLPEPNDGEYTFYRHYFCTNVSVGQSLNSHFFHMGQGGVNGSTCTHGQGCYSGRIFWEGNNVQSGGLFQLQSPAPMFSMDNIGRGGGGFYWNGDSATPWRRLQLYIVEFRITHFNNSDSATWDARITYANNGSLAAESDDFICGIGACNDIYGGGDVDYLGQYPTLTVDGRRFMGFEIGKNTEVGATSTKAYLEFGGTALRRTTNSSAWIGAYPVGPEAS